MKNLARILVMSLLVGLFGVVAVSSLLATPTSGVQTTTATTSFAGENGIRWNAGFGVFEVYNAAGVSYIGSNVAFDENGNKAGSQAASGDKIYHIMQDIHYETTSSINAAFENGTRYQLSSSGVVNGRGFGLKNFPIKNGTALFDSNQGTIQNLNIINPSFDSGTEVGIIAKQNSGIIEDCEVSGLFLNLNEAISIAAISYTGGGTIRNCVNKLSISTNGAFAAGIMLNPKNAIIFGCSNYGSIRSNAVGSIVGGIAASVEGGELLNNINDGAIVADEAGGIVGSCDEATIKSNKNFGSITGAASAAGIIGGELSTFFQIDNFNYGEFNAQLAAPIHLGENTIEAHEYGIYYDADLNALMIENMVGLSYIGSELSFDTAGALVVKDAPNSAVASVQNTTYHIVRDIDYSEISVHVKTPLNIGNGTTIEGNNHQLRNFPIRIISEGTSAALFGAIGVGAHVKNINLTTSSTEAVGNTGIFSFTNNGKIEGCTVSGNINTTNQANIGGFAYYTAETGTPEFIDCINMASITARASRIGGIFAYGVHSTVVKFTRCVNKGDLTSYGGETGAIVAGIAAYSPRLELTDCHNTGNIYSYAKTATTNVLAAGIVGWSGAMSKATGCTNSGDISAYGDFLGYNVVVAGIYAWSGGVSIIVDSKNLAGATLTLLGSIDQSNIGGILALGVMGAGGNVEVYSPEKQQTIQNVVGSLVYNCVNDGDIIIKNGKYGSGRRVGGIVGRVIGGAKDGIFEVVDCIFGGTFNLDESPMSPTTSMWVSVAGIVGRVEGTVPDPTTLRIDSCTNNSDLYTTRSNWRMGGILGEADVATLIIVATNCVNEGDVISEGGTSLTGKLAGSIANLELEGLTCTGDGIATSNQYVGNYLEIA